MGGFLVLMTVLVTVVIMPTTEPGIKIIDTQENSITLQAFNKNSDRAELYARGFCNKKGKQHKLNSEFSRSFKFPSGLNNYRYDCVSQSEEEATITPTTNEEVSEINTVEEDVSEANIVEEVSEPENVISSECPSNQYVGQKQADGSWETVCKE